MVNIQAVGAGVNERKIIQKAIFDSLVKLLSSEREPYVPVKGKANIIMFVGLQVNNKFYPREVVKPQQ